MNLDLDGLKAALAARSPDFAAGLVGAARRAESFREIFALASLRKKAIASGLVPKTRPSLRLGIVGGYTLSPLTTLIEFLLSVEGLDVEIFSGECGADSQEILNEASALYAFKPSVVVWMPAEQSCRYAGSLLDPREQQQAAASRFAQGLIDGCTKLHAQAGCEVVLANFALPGRCDLGPLRARSLGSEWSFKKQVNLELGASVPSFVHLCDVEFLANRAGALSFEDAGRWFESKQPGSPEFLAAMAREIGHTLMSLRRPAKKVLVLDLDNTLWGGVVGEDGVEGIEIGDTSPRGEAFKAFQRYVKGLASRGILLAIASKNDEAEALAPFARHPEMVLRRADLAVFKANWRPKSENLREIAADLRVGVDSLVFVDDNPAEVELVRQQVPEVECIALGPDPSAYVAQLQDCRFFESRSLTAEDAQRSEYYRTTRAADELRSSVADLQSYWTSLGMEADFHELRSVDVARVAQLINKSNQFNVTTRRRSEAEVSALMERDHHVVISVRLRDRFGDHGLIGVVIGRRADETMEIDTWLMSCRVLQRQVENETLNELVRVARARGCRTLRGYYLPTPKNGLVRDLFPSLGFTALADGAFEIALDRFENQATQIRVARRSYESA